MKMPEEFYVGWEDHEPAPVRRTLRRTVWGLVLAALASGTALAICQATIGTAAFEWGHPRRLAGVLRATPYPCLEIRLPGSSAERPDTATYPLVGVGKHGLAASDCQPLDGFPVTLEGTLIYNRQGTQVEVVEGSLRQAGGRAVPPPRRTSLGRMTLVGEIVDSKCHLGVMNPGRFVPHKACAIRCIRGGIPPVFVVDRDGASPLQFLLLSREGTPVNRQVLGLVAEPLMITGEVERLGDLLLLRADPGTFRRVAR